VTQASREDDPRRRQLRHHRRRRARGPRIFDNIRKFLRYLLSSNMGEVLTVSSAWSARRRSGSADRRRRVVLPLLATQILWINLVTDSAPALAMGVDPETDDVMAARRGARRGRSTCECGWACSAPA
jgi:magnesium-transporting ATPase (P-type)